MPTRRVQQPNRGHRIEHIWRRRVFATRRFRRPSGGFGFVCLRVFEENVFFFYQKKIF